MGLKAVERVSFSSLERAKDSAKELLNDFENSSGEERERVRKVAERAALKAAGKGKKRIALAYRTARNRMTESLSQEKKKSEQKSFRTSWNKFVSKKMKDYPSKDISSGKAMKEIAKQWRKKKGKQKESKETTNSNQTSSKGTVDYTLNQVEDKEEEDLSDLGAPIGWIGGKSTVTEKIIDKFPEHKTYVEPFFGAGHVYFNKAPSEKEVINDKDKRVYDFFKNLPKVNPEKCENKSSKKRFEKLKGIERFKGQKSKVCDFLYLNKHSYNNDMKNYVKDKKPKYTKIRKKWEKYRKRLNNTKIHRKDYKKIIEKYDSPQTFYYLDPPYFLDKQKHYRLHKVKPEEVLEAVKGIEGKFLLSYNNHDKVKEVFKDYNISKMKITYTAPTNTSGSQNRYELLISNYKW